MQERSKFEHQRALYGHLLKKAFHFGLQGVSRLSSHDFIDAPSKRFCKTVLTATYTSRVFGLVDTSGAGKTKMGLSPAFTNQAHVVYIRLAETGDDCSFLSPVQVLCRELQLLLDRVNQDSKAASSTRTARLALDLVREFVCSYYDILIEADEACQPASTEDQRRLWVAILENGFSSDRLCTRVSERLAERLSTDLSGNSEVALIVLETKLRERISRVGVDGKKAPLILFMDNLHAVKDVCSDLWSLEDYEVRRYRALKQRWSIDFKRPTDLYYAIRVILSEVALRGVGAVYAGTQLWLRDPISVEATFSLNSQLHLWSEFCVMQPSDMLAFLRLYFDGIPISSPESQDHADCLVALAPLQGRPRFFFTTFLPEFLDRVKGAHISKEMVAIICETARKAASVVLSQLRDTLRAHWHERTTTTPNPLERTVTVPDLFACACLLNGKLPFRRTELAEVMANGILFFGSDQEKYNLHTEPLLLQALFAEGNYNLTGAAFAHQLDIIAQFARAQTTELTLAWHFVRQLVLAGDEEAFLSQAIKELLPRGYDLPAVVTQIKLTAATAMATLTDATTLDEMRSSCHVLHTLPGLFGPDVIVPGQMRDSSVVLAIQCMSRRAKCNEEDAPSVISLVSEDDLKFRTIDQVDAVCSANRQEDPAATFARLAQENLQLRARIASYMEDASTVHGGCLE
ncbi:hypothetical protein CAOG_03082 [Capsaspora owczarzaki ATCC 30864]|uniref:hypothetical protein n=1 Tax=Capsaspora owczarzaki (strain ATCC 30864) TaxID=595528 RepID=UPI0001FE5925|nr:hypothetical protein CAOG_03082 [Capsaspora owczarzaki ATCC 30864]|eukprot:XP_004363921.1 hypothetical protein CAOG_03082 [Capsaspora owczarzaki ATCC 30864]